MGCNAPFRNPGAGYKGAFSVPEVIKRGAQDLVLLSVWILALHTGLDFTGGWGVRS